MIVVFFFNDTATTEIYTLSLHDALPICEREINGRPFAVANDQHGPVPTSGAIIFQTEQGSDPAKVERVHDYGRRLDRKSTRLNSSHANISYAVFCLKKKKIMKKS